MVSGRQPTDTPCPPPTPRPDATRRGKASATASVFQIKTTSAPRRSFLSDRLQVVAATASFSTVPQVHRRPRRLQLLIDGIKEEADQLPNSLVIKLVASFLRRCRRSVASHGGSEARSTPGPRQTRRNELTNKVIKKSRRFGRTFSDISVSEDCLSLTSSASMS